MWSFSQTYIVTLHQNIQLNYQFLFHLQPSLSSIPDNLTNQKDVIDHILSNDNGGVDAVNRRETFSRANSIKETTGCVKNDDGLSVGSNATIGGTKTATILVSKTKTKTGLPLLLKNSIN